jgi:hypothetical protein
MLVTVLAANMSLIRARLLVFLTSAWMAPVTKSLIVVILNSYLARITMNGHTSVKVSPLSPRLRELTNGPFERVRASNLTNPDGNSLLKNSLAVLAKSPYLTSLSLAQCHLYTVDSLEAINGNRRCCAAHR